MKKVLIGFALVLVLAIGVSAQDDAAGSAKVIGKGIKAGGALFKLTGSDAGSVDSKFGFSGGGFVNYPFTPQISGQLEVLYVMKGAKSGSGDAEHKLKLSYIEIPVTFVYNIPTEGNFKPNIFAGPEISFLTKADIVDGSGTTDIKDFMKSSDFGVVFGAGFLYQMESFGITFDARYDLGLTKIQSADDYNTMMGLTSGDIGYMTDDPKIKNGGFSGHVGVSF